jgi:hypothetical protein
MIEATRPEGEEFYTFGAEAARKLERLRGEHNWEAVKGPEFYPDPERADRWIVWPFDTEETRARTRERAAREHAKHPFKTWLLERLTRRHLK